MMEKILIKKIVIKKIIVKNKYLLKKVNLCLKNIGYLSLKRKKFTQNMCSIFLKNIKPYMNIELYIH